MDAWRRQRGFTLIELVVTIVVAGIVAAIGGMLIVTPVQQWRDLGRRTAQVDAAELALRRMQRDVRQALPNSVRIGGGGTTLELLHASDGGRYRAELAVGTEDLLDFTAADGSFDVLGSLRAAPVAGSYAVIYNLTASGPDANAYVGDNRALIGAGSTVDKVVVSPSFLFPRPSPYQRFFIVDEAVSYVCDLGAKTLTRYAGYAIAVAPTLSGGALLANNVAGCDFGYAAGTPQRAALVTLRLTLTDSAGESVTLLHQMHVENGP